MDRKQLIFAAFRLWLMLAIDLVLFGTIGFLAGEIQMLWIAFFTATKRA